MMSSVIRVAALPLQIKLADKKANLAAVEKKLKELPQGIDILVLPELFSTGYTEDVTLLHELAERNTQHTVDRLKEWASRYNFAIAGSYLASTPPSIYNRAFFIEPGGEETFYDKRHLFSMGNENKCFRAGEKRFKPVRFRGWNISMAVCYDLRFPVWCRAERGDIDLLIIPANWPESRAYAWEHLLIARAIENQCCVIGANRGGEDEYGQYDNLSYIFDALGKPVGVRTKSSDAVIADLDKEKLEKYRDKFPVYLDADSFMIQS